MKNNLIPELIDGLQTIHDIALEEYKIFRQTYTDIEPTTSDFKDIVLECRKLLKKLQENQ